MIAVTFRGFNPGFNVAQRVLKNPTWLGRKRIPPTTILSIGRHPNFPREPQLSGNQVVDSLVTPSKAKHIL